MILSLTAALLMVSGETRQFFNDSVFLTQQIEGLENDVKEAQLEQALLHEQIFDYQQSVVAAIGQEAQPKTWAQMNLLVQARSIASVPEMDRSGMLLERGKDLFNKNQYKEAATSFQQLIDKFPASPKSLEARFLRAESLFLSGQLDLCVDQVEVMMTQFPDHPMTGFLMLRLSQILKIRNRAPESNEVLNMIQRNFPGETLLQQQVRSLEGEKRIL